MTVKEKTVTEHVFLIDKHDIWCGRLCCRGRDEDDEDVSWCGCQDDRDDDAKYLMERTKCGGGLHGWSGRWGREGPSYCIEESRSRWKDH